MLKLERVSLGTAIITEAVIMAENPSSKIPRDRLQRYMNYRLLKMAWGKTAYSILMRSVKTLSASSWTGDSYEVSGFALAINLWAMSSVNVLGKSLGKPCETSSSSDPLCLHWDSTRTPTITEDKEQRKNKDHSMSNSEKLDKLIQMVRMKKGVTPPREVQQQVEDDAEVDAKDSENPETNGDGEMNNDASKKPVKVTKKRGRGNKGIVGPNFGQYHNGPRSKT
ncbi:hypothetical protein HID58_079665 [Brassica napus]|uniref:Uncharacterized protein n=1 Tax=Brassica napus TaxID=3708 RepID=A0ABQ7Y3Y5_BRANA|nr:hypothetical protein HID58_079665 [Brassica napus]